MTTPLKSQTWTLKPEHRVNYGEPYSPIVEVSRWREHDGIVHLLYEMEYDTPWQRDPNVGIVEHTQVHNWVTPCGIRLEPLEVGEAGGPVAVEAQVTCVTCLVAECDLA